MTIKKFFENNGLSLILLLMFLLALTGQLKFGYSTWNEDLRESGVPPISLLEYARSGHFIAATFENWESEFFQMGMYVLLTVWLRQRGSAESRPFSEEEKAPFVSPGIAPWPVRRGGGWKRVYATSLSLALFLLFGASFVLHLKGSWRHAVDEALIKGQAPTGILEHLTSARFWFESMQNWQSEFLSVLALVVLSIWLRQENSPQSKPLVAPHTQTGT